ncbi:unnamed protein product [Clonostachys rosea f. rosea IK726]|uniref:Uncharacterized protein n=1 Tax=Clonostachys rosea f. rosea IK726 TaxID=1349383 RepID=A0ACA9UIM8_BIOOC|nr:unnamed protein product [Clonostachys rosea f. rosea IK726]
MKLQRLFERLIMKTRTIWCTWDSNEIKDTFTKNYFAIQASNNTNTTNNENTSEDSGSSNSTPVGAIAGVSWEVLLDCTYRYCCLVLPPPTKPGNRRTLSGRSKGALGRSAKLRPS